MIVGAAPASPNEVGERMRASQSIMTGPIIEWRVPVRDFWRPRTVDKQLNPKPDPATSTRGLLRRR
jgi:hypothetical protein